MTYLKINDMLYPAIIRGWAHDKEWDNRDSLAVTLEMTHEEAMALFVDELVWGHVYEDGGAGETTEYDDSDYSLAGPVTDNRDGTITVKMGKLLDSEALAILLGGV